MRATFMWALAIAFSVCPGIQEIARGEKAPVPRAGKIRVLVVTGGHSFDEAGFFAMFKDVADLDCKYVAYPEAIEWFAPDKASQYDVAVLYDMWRDLPLPQRKTFEELVRGGKPIVSLHHSVSSYQQWPEFHRIIGGKYQIKAEEGKPAAKYFHDVTYKVAIADPKHPITRFMKDFEVCDETYLGVTIEPGVHPLLTTDHAQSDRVLGWTKTYGKARVVYLAPGHGPKIYADPNYRRLIRQSIRWAADRLPEQSEEGFVSLFNGKNLDGWHKMRDPKSFEVVNGVIRSESGIDGLWLRSDKQYRDFILRIEWRISKEGNSGVFVRSRKEGYPWDPGTEVQISNQYRDDFHCTGAIYSYVSVSPRPDETAEVWHEFEIQCRGPRITVFADGVPVVDVDQRKVPGMKDFPLFGYVGVQDSHNATGWVEYRNIRIKELDSRKD